MAQAVYIHVADEPHIVERRHRQLCTRCHHEIYGYDLDHPPNVVGEAFHPMWFTPGVHVGQQGGSQWITRETPTCEAV